MFRVYEIECGSRVEVGTFESRELARQFIGECIQVRVCGSFYILRSTITQGVK